MSERWALNLNCGIRRYPVPCSQIAQRQSSLERMNNTSGSCKRCQARAATVVCSCILLCALYTALDCEWEDLTPTPPPAATTTTLQNIHTPRLHLLTNVSSICTSDILLESNSSFVIQHSLFLACMYVYTRCTFIHRVQGWPNSVKKGKQRFSSTTLWKASLAGQNIYVNNLINICKAGKKSLYKFMLFALYEWSYTLTDYFHEIHVNIFLNKAIIDKHSLFYCRRHQTA